MKNNNWIWIVGLLLLVLISSNSQKTNQSIILTNNLQSVVDSTTLSVCQQSRDSYPDSPCRTECVLVTQKIVDCLGGYDLTSDDIGKYAYFRAPFERTCAESDTHGVTRDDKHYSYKTIRECMVGGSGEDEGSEGETSAECSRNSDCDSGEVCADKECVEACDNFWEDPSNDCSTHKYIIYGGIGFLVLIAFSFMKKR